MSSAPTEAFSPSLPARMSHPVLLEDRKQDILGFLRNPNVKTVVLLGEAGVGKTWMAREVSQSAILEGLCYAILWIIPEYLHKGRSLVEIISLQLSAYPLTSAEREDAGHDADVVEEQKVDILTVEKLILEKLAVMRSAQYLKVTTPRLDEVGSGMPEQNGEKKADQKDAPYLLMVLDDILKEDEDEIQSEISRLLRPEHVYCHKVLVTRRDSGSDGSSDEMNEKIQTVIKDKIFHSMTFLSQGESSDLLKNTVESKFSTASNFSRLSRVIFKGSSGHPGAIVMMAKALNHCGTLEPEIAIEEASSHIESTDATPNANLTRLMQYVFEMLQSTTISNCAWYCQHLFQQHGGIHFNELITYWLMEGYFEHPDHVEVAYREAHLVLMELLDRGILSVKEDNYVCMESDAMRLDDYRRHGLSGSACLGLPNVLDGTNWEGLGRVTQTHGMIKGSRWPRKEISTLLIDGGSLCREVLEKFFEPKKLKVLVILNPKFKELPKVFSELMELQILVLRACTQLEKVDEIQELAQLLVLEVSGASFLNKLSDDLFKEMKNLRSINLSRAGIQSLPSSLFDLAELRWLILRKCPHLKLKSGKRFPMKLEVIDLSGSSEVNTLGRRIADLENFQTLDISGTKVERLPFFENMPKLGRLILRECQRMSRLPTLKELSDLQILDCSNSNSLKEVQDESLRAKFVDLSDCPMQRLPPKIGNQSHILLRNCRSLEKLPSTKDLKDLEVLDLSNASSFTEFEDLSFEHLRSLRQVNLSNTMIKALPPLSPLTELRQLLLINCGRLEDLSGLSTLEKLEVLDLSGCHKLVIREDESFKSMSYLKILNLSYTKVTSLPLDCFPKSLRQLIIRNCIELKELPSLEHLSDLEVLDLAGLKSLSNKKIKCIKDMTKLTRLDLSEMVVDEFPSLANLTNLIELSLKGCSYKVSGLEASRQPELEGQLGTKNVLLPPLETFSNLQKLSLGGVFDLPDLKLKSLSQLEDLDLFEIKMEDFPYEISELTGLTKLRLQVKKEITELDWKRIKYIPDDFELVGCGSRSTVAESILINRSQSSVTDKVNLMVIFGTGFFKFLEKEKNFQLWDKCFQQFHFSVWPPRKEEGKQGDEMTCYLGERALLRDIESQSRVPNHEDLKMYLEIHGSYDLLSPHKDVLTRVDHISLIDDCSIDCVSIIDVDILKIKKSCWLERCKKMRCVIDGGEEPIALEKLKYLYLCNLSSLEYICSDNLQSQIFVSLKSLFIECCPKLNKVFHLSKLPEKLETLEVKFCDGMDTLFHPEESVKCNLQYLHLTGLPNLKSIGAALPSLKKLKVRGCPKLSSIVVSDECEVFDDCRKVQIDRLPK